MPRLPGFGVNLLNGPATLRVIARAATPSSENAGKRKLVFAPFLQTREATVMPKTLKRVLPFVPALAIIGIVLPGAEPQTQKALDAREQSTPLIQSVKGPDLFRAYCASCHGMDAKGTGPAAPALKARVPDLTLLSRRNLGRFPAAHVREVIVGEHVIAAHGSREMPIWGPIFHQVEGDQDWGNVRLENLVKYLATIQSIQSANSSSGVELYKPH